MTAVKTDKSNTDETKSAILAGGDVNLQITPIGPKDPSQDIIASSSHRADPVIEPGTNAQERSEQRDAAIEGSQGLDLQVEQTEEKNQDTAENGNLQHPMDDKPYSVFSHNEKKMIIICVGLSQFFSPISGQIYFPSLDAIAADLHVSSSLVNLTITSYLASGLV